MPSLPTINFKLSQLYPGTGSYRLNTCPNPDCTNFGKPFVERSARRQRWQTEKPDLRPEEAQRFEAHGAGAYKLAGANKAYARVSRTFDYEGRPHKWSDQRTMRCLGLTSDGKVCNSGFSILSPAHIEEEVERLRNQNDVLDGPACGACGVRVLDRPNEFVLNGTHEGHKKRKATPKAIRLVHKPCRGRKGARFTVSLPHAKQKNRTDNLRILDAVLNSAGIADIQRMIGSPATGKTIGFSRIYDRIAWLEEVFLAYEREMLRRWREKCQNSGQDMEHKLCHDDMVLTVNWETSTDRRNTQLNCAVTADAQSGYIYRLDVDFDPRISPLDLFNQTYLDEHRLPQNLHQHYPGRPDRTAPKFSWQRPTGRFHEAQFFEACVNEIQAFQTRIKRRMPKKSTDQIAARNQVLQQTDAMVAQIRDIAEGWFGFQMGTSQERGSFKGATTRDIYTKAAHLILVKEALPPGRIVLTTEQEATLPPLISHIFEKEIKEDRFAWMVLSFNKKATKPDRLRKVKAYRKERMRFHNDGLYSGRFTLETPPQEVTEAFIADRMVPASRPSTSGKPFQISNYQIGAFPPLWVHAPTQASGELDKVVGFPVLPRGLRRSLKRLPGQVENIPRETRDDLAHWNYKATLQPVSTFMNSLRERLSPADRAGRGGARLSGTYIQGAIFNPRTLIQLLNIFRIHYNFFELRPYTCPFEEVDDLVDPPLPKPRAIRIPGTDEHVDLPARIRRVPVLKTPAMRHGIDAVTRRKDGTEDVPDLHRILYRPWLLAGTKFGARLDRPRIAAMATRKINEKPRFRTVRTQGSNQATDQWPNQSFRGRQKEPISYKTTQKSEHNQR